MNDDFPLDLDRIDARARAIGREVFANLPDQRPGVFDRRWWDDHLMNWSMADDAVKVELFRFVDVLPMLHTGEAVTRHLQEYLGEVRERLPASLNVALGLARRTPMVRGAVAKAARLAAMDFARRFIAGSNVQEVVAAARQQRRLNRAFTLDILGEAVTSDKDAEGYFQAYCDLLASIAPVVNDWPDAPRIDRDAASTLPRMNLSIKLSALDAHFDSMDFDGTARCVAARLRQLFRI
ncbi:MAG: proline dehydrogenase family protein, partial [Planctomycetales bacterium]|nr:proline dehydrogenase family protein [Planctomycetales bacterium]